MPVEILGMNYPPAIKPMIKPPIGPTDPLAGVMEAKPAMQPVTAPTKEDFPNLTFSMMIQTIVAVAADM